MFNFASILFEQWHYSLELNIRQRILSDLATLETETEEDLLTTRDLIQSKAQLADEKHSAPNGGSRERAETRTFIVGVRPMSVLALIIYHDAARGKGSLQYCFRGARRELSGRSCCEAN